MRSRSVLPAVALLLALAPPLAATSPCPIGLQTGTAVTVDGVQGAEWNDASQLTSASPCFETLLDEDGVSKDITVFSKRYTRTGVNYLGFFLEVNDTSTEFGGGLLLNGERIAFQFDANLSGGGVLAGAGADVAKDYKVQIVHRWEQLDADLELENVQVTVFDGSGDPGFCGHPVWNDITAGLPAAQTPTVAVRQLSAPTRYTVEVEIPLALLGNPAGDVGAALAVVNDFGTCVSGVCDGYGASIPNNLPVTNADNPVNGCQDGWSIPDTWATGYVTTPPPDVWLSHVPAYWISNDVDAYRCNVQDNSYYPADPCRLRVEGCFNNSSSSPQTRNLLFLRGRYGIGVPDWTVVELRKNVSLPASARTCLKSIETTAGLIGLTGHPCIRVYVLPPAFKPDFDEADILAITTDAQLTQMSDVYGLSGHHSAQQNISRLAESAVCPDAACQVALLDRQPDLPRPEVRTASLSAPLLFAPLQREEPGGEQDPPVVRDPGGHVLLPPADLEKLGRDHLIIQVRGFGTGQPPSDKPPYNFHEEIGGIVQLIPVGVLQQQGEIRFQFEVGNPTREEKTIFLQLDAHIPPGLEGVELALDTKPQRFKPGEVRKVTAVARIGGRTGTTGTGGTGRFGFSLHAGINEPHGDLADIADGDLSWMVDLEFRLTDRVTLELLYGHHEFAGVEDLPDPEIDQLSVNAKLFFPGGFWQPFVNGGVGSYDVDPGGSDSGANAGFGVLHMFPSGFGVELGYNFHRVFASPDIDFSTLLLGLRWRP